MMKKCLLVLLLCFGICQAQDIIDPPIELRQSLDGNTLYIKRIIHHITDDKTEQKHLTYNKISRKNGQTESCSEEEFLQGTIISAEKAKSFLYSYDHIPCVDEHLGQD